MDIEDDSPSPYGRGQGEGLRICLGFYLGFARASLLAGAATSPGGRRKTAPTVARLPCRKVLIAHPLKRLLNQIAVRLKKAARDPRVRKFEAARTIQEHSCVISCILLRDEVREDRKSTRLNSSHIPLSRM